MDPKMHTIHRDEESFADDFDDLAAEIQALMPGERFQKSELFTKLFPVIEDAFARNVPQKDILALLARKGLKLHPVRFKSMLTEERERNFKLPAECCQTCGAVLSNSRMCQPNSSSDDTEQNDQIDDDSQVIA